MNTPKPKRAGRLLLLVALVLSMPMQPAGAAPEAVFTVNSLNDVDDGACNAAHCSLREAINAANNNYTTDTIRFSVSGTIALAATLPTVQKAGGALTIDAADRNIVINGPGTDRIFAVDLYEELTLQKLVIQNGRASNSGGGIYNRGALTLVDCTLSDNQASLYGGAIYTEGTLRISNTTFYRNIVGEVAHGGAIYIHKGQVTISGGVFQENSAMFSGGAIYNRYEGETQGGDLTIYGTNFILNTAVNGYGGAIFNQNDLEINAATFGLNQAETGGGLYNDKGGTFTVRNSIFSYNRSTWSGGGGLYIDAISGASSVYDSRIENNFSNEDGGGFYIYQGTAVFDRTRIAYNEATRDGGGGYNRDGLSYLLHDTIESNDAGQHGGGYYNLKSMLVDSSTFNGNTAAGQGGGIYHEPLAQNVTIKNSTFFDNRAEQGGGLYVHGMAEITNCTISDNRATSPGGGLYDGAGITYIRNTILANNNTGGNCAYALGGAPPTNNGNNLDSGASCSFGSAKGSLSGVNPLLGLLADNGGPTKTMMIAPVSPAVDAVIYNAPNDCPAVDQRGYSRPFGARCDIGAVEQGFRVFLPLAMEH